MQSLFVHEIFKGIQFSEEQSLLVAGKFTCLKLEKGDILLRAGQSVPNQFYVHSGCLRTFFLDESGKEHTIQFAVKDWWISDYTAFFTGGQAILSIECIQEGEVYQISKESMELLYLQTPAIETFFRIKMERFFASFQKRILSDLALSAKDSYKKFIATYPDIEQNIKNYHLASYLGIATESLSRIRKEMARE